MNIPGLNYLTGRGVNVERGVACMILRNHVSFVADDDPQMFNCHMCQNSHKITLDVRCYLLPLKESHCAMP